MHFKKKKIRLNLIDLQDTRYRITTKKSDADLVDSIKSVGLLRPPLLLRKNSSYCIVSGFRRIFAFAALDYSNIEALIINNSKVQKDIVKIAISENALQRPLNIIEKARALKLLSTCIHDSSDLMKTATSVGVACDRELVTKLLKISSLTDSVQEGLINEYISMPVALILEKYDHHTANLFANVFRKLHLSLNRQRELISLITEIAHRDAKIPAQLMKEEFFTEVMNNNSFDRNQKTKELRKRLREIRYPEISKTEKIFMQSVNALNIGKRVKLIPPKHFEGVNYMFQLTFKNIKEVESIKSSLDRVIKDPEFKKILNNSINH